MNIWFFLWILLSIVLLGATAWSTIILFQQKEAWQKFAKKFGLTFRRGTFFGPCEMEGVYKGYNLSLFTAVQQNEDPRKNRQVTVMQVTANVPFVDGVAMGTSQVKAFLMALESLTEHEVHSPKWNKAHLIRSRNKAAVDRYLTEQRIETLRTILSMPNADILILMDENEGVFRFETSNPLKNEQQIHSLLEKLIARIQILTPSEEERSLFGSAEILAPRIEKNISLKGGADDLETGGLELEEEEEPSASDPITPSKPSQ